MKIASYNLILKAWNSPTFTTLSSLAIRMGGVALLLPAAMAAMPSTHLAIWQLYLSINALMMMLDFGLSPTFTRLISYTLASNTSSEKAWIHTTQEIITIQRQVSKLLALSITMVTGILGTLAIIRPMALEGNSTQAWISWFVMVGTIGINYLGNSYGTLLQGLGHVAIFRRWEAITGLGQLISSLLIVIFSTNLLLVVINQQLWFVIALLRNKFLIQQLNPELSLTVKVIKLNSSTKAQIRKIWHPTWRSGLGSILAQGAIQFSGILYAQVMDAQAVANYLIILRIVTAISALSQAPFYSRIPIFAKLFAESKFFELSKIATRYIKQSLYMYSLGIIFAWLIVTAYFTMIDTRGEYIFEINTYLGLASAVLIERIGALYLQLQSLSNDIKWHKASAITSLIAIFVTYIGLDLLKTAAFPIGMLIANILWFAPYSIYQCTRTYEQISLKIVLGSAVGPILVFIIFIIFSKI